jgi:hypothetical protein
MKLFLQMAAFYKYVLFKRQEFYEYTMKSKQAIIARKIAHNDGEDAGAEKGLILASIKIRKPISIKFINKYACKLVGYDRKHALELKVEDLMPNVVAENH